ncbi:MAG: hypothetical protein JWP27_2804, partial [Flaviaesturariibacter sp.]|nr:hypothetical protein [Flaviaesturariibacter sp.]
MKQYYGDYDSMKGGGGSEAPGG